MTTNKQDIILGFVKRAQELGYTEKQAFELYKQATGEDAGVSLPPPPAPGQGAAVNPDLAQLEQFLQSLPPEQLQQIIQEIEQELGGGVGDVAGGTPQDDQIYAKQAEYIDSFYATGLERGFTVPQISYFYKEALAHIEGEAKERQIKVASTDAEDLRWRGFLERAAEYNIPAVKAAELYRSSFQK